MPCEAGDSGRWTVTLLINDTSGDRHVSLPHTRSLTLAFLPL